MRCHEAKNELDEQLTACGILSGGEIQLHLDSCKSCRNYYAELLALNNSLSPLGNIELTETESEQMITSVTEKMILEPVPIPIQSKESKLFSILRISAALAAVFIIVSLVWEPSKNINENDYASWTELDICEFDSEILTSIYYEIDETDLTSLVSQSSVSYLTNEIEPGNVDDMFEGIDIDELAWLSENLSLGI